MGERERERRRRKEREMGGGGEAGGKFCLANQFVDFGYIVWFITRTTLLSAKCRLCKRDVTYSYVP